MPSPNTWGVHLTISAFTNKIRFYGSKNLIFVNFLQCAGNLLFCLCCLDFYGLKNKNCFQHCFQRCQAFAILIPLLAMAGTRYVTQSMIAERSAAWLSALRPWSRSRPLPSLTHSAIALLDLQHYFADPRSHAYLPALEAVLDNILTLVQEFRQAGRPIIFTRHGSLPPKENTENTENTETLMRRWWKDELRRGEARTELIAPLAQMEPDLLIDKECYSAFHGTPLLSWLRDRQCDTLVICGVMTHLCCETTARDAFMGNISPVVVADGCASTDEELHLGSLRGLAHGFAVVSSAAQVSRALNPERSDREAEKPTPTPTSLPTKADMVVVGGGPAGLSAAVQARRSGLHVVVVEHRRLGGQARAAECIENYLGFPGGISGRALMDRFEAQALALELEIIKDRAKGVTRKQHGLALALEHSPELKTQVVILATGATALPLSCELGPASIDTLEDLPSVRHKSLLIIGGGEAAFDQALLAHRLGARQVVIALRGAAPRAMSLLVHRAREREIQVLTRTTLQRVTRSTADHQASPYLAHLDQGEQRQGGQREQQGPRGQQGQGGQRVVLPVDAVLVCIGKRSVLPALPAELECHTSGTPQVDHLGRTSINGLYIVGDARRGAYRQVSIATGDGVASAMHAARYISTGVWKE